MNILLGILGGELEYRKIIIKPADGYLYGLLAGVCNGFYIIFISHVIQRGL